MVHLIIKLKTIDFDISRSNIYPDAEKCTKSSTSAGTLGNY